MKKKMIVGILVGVAAVVAIPLTAALFINKDYKIEREVVINKPKTEVFNFVKHLRNQEKFSKWVMQDPNQKTNFRGTDGEVGFVYAWDSEMSSAGKGEQEIKALKDGENIDIEIRFERPFKNTARTPITLEQVGDNQTKVRWAMVGRSEYPMNFMTAIFSGGLGKDLQTSLNNLKSILEK